MAELGEYVFFALALSGVLGLIGSLSHAALHREAYLALGALCLFALALPVARALPELLSLPSFDGSDITAVGEGGYLATSEDAFAEGVARYVVGEYSLNADEVSVELSGFDFESMRAEEITVTLTGRAVYADLIGIRESVESELVAEGGECKVVIYP